MHGVYPYKINSACMKFDKLEVLICQLPFDPNVIVIQKLSSL